MGLWVGIKRALNSTVGTKEFKPLDQIVIGSKGLRASDNYYTVLSLGSTGAISASSLYPYVNNNWFKMNWSGNFKLKLWCGYNSYPGSVEILKNDEVVSSIVPTETESQEYTTGIITFEKGDIFGIRCSPSRGSTQISSAYMCAEVEDLSAFTML